MANAAAAAAVAIPALAQRQEMSHADLGNLLIQLGEDPPRTKAARLARLEVLAVARAAPGGAGGALFVHQYRPNSALANFTALLYGLPSLNMLPAPRWSREMLLSPAAWPLLVQAHAVKRQQFWDTPERLSPAMQPFRLGIQASFGTISPEDLHEAEQLYRSIAIEYLSLEDPTHDEMRNFIFVEIKPYVAKATALMQDIYMAAEGISPEARQVLVASRSLALSSLPAHMSTVGTHMLKAMEKAATATKASTAADPKTEQKGTKRERDAADFYCRKCDGWFADPNHRFTERHKRD